MTRKTNSTKKTGAPKKLSVPQKTDTQRGEHRAHETREQLLQRLTDVLWGAVLQKVPEGISEDLLDQFLCILAEYDAQKKSKPRVKRKRAGQKKAARKKNAPKSKRAQLSVPHLSELFKPEQPVWDPEWDADRSDAWQLDQDDFDFSAGPAELMSREAMNMLCQAVYREDGDLLTGCASDVWLGDEQPGGAALADKTPQEVTLKVPFMSRSFLWLAAQLGDPLGQRQHGLFNLDLSCEDWSEELFRPEDTAEAMAITGLQPRSLRAALCWLRLAARGGDEIAKAVLLARRLKLTVVPGLLFMPDKLAS